MREDHPLRSILIRSALRHAYIDRNVRRCVRANRSSYLQTLKTLQNVDRHSLSLAWVPARVHRRVVAVVETDVVPHRLHVDVSAVGVQPRTVRLQRAPPPPMIRTAARTRRPTPTCVRSPGGLVTNRL